MAGEGRARASERGGRADWTVVGRGGAGLTARSVAGAGGGGCPAGGNDFQWCFSQVKGAVDEDVAEGEARPTPHPNPRAPQGHARSAAGPDAAAFARLTGVVPGDPRPASG
jgi:hypothetical protein